MGSELPASEPAPAIFYKEIFCQKEKFKIQQQKKLLLEVLNHHERGKKVVKTAKSFDFLKFVAKNIDIWF
jgi:hypothetical protein